MRLPQELIKYKTRFVVKLWSWEIMLNYGMPADTYPIEMSLSTVMCGEYEGVLAGIIPQYLVDPHDMRMDGSRSYFACLGIQHLSSWSMQLFHHQVSMGEKIYDFQMLCDRSYLCVDQKSYDAILKRSKQQFGEDVFEASHFERIKRRYVLITI